MLTFQYVDLSYVKPPTNYVSSPIVTYLVEFVESFMLKLTNKYENSNEKIGIRTKRKMIV